MGRSPVGATATFALGANLWLLAVGVPLLLARAIDLPGGIAGTTLLVMAGPLVFLYGLVLRSPGALLAVYPFAVALPVIVLGSPEVHALAPVPIVLAAGSLVAYLVFASRWLAESATASDAKRRSVAQPPLPERWRRRMRVYRGLAAAAIVFPSVMIAWATLWPANEARFAESFGASVESARALIVVAIGLACVIVFRFYLLAPLHAHLAHDRDLGAHLEAARAQARRGRPRLAFYVAFACALAAIASVIANRPWSR